MKVMDWKAIEIPRARQCKRPAFRKTCKQWLEIRNCFKFRPDWVTHTMRSYTDIMRSEKVHLSWRGEKMR